VIPVDIVVVDEIDRQRGAPRGQDLMIACHQRALDDAAEAKAAVIMLSADFIFSDCALAAVVENHRQGYRAVLNTGLRLAKESFVRSLEDRRPDLGALSSRQLVRMALPHLHPETRSMFVDAPRFMAAPFAVYWPVGKDGLVARCFQLHPLMIDPMIRRPLKGTNDGHFVSRVCPDHSRVHVVTDSDELQMFELTTLERRAGTSDGGVSLLRCAMMANERDPLQLSYWTRTNICLHTDDLDRRWAAACAEAQVFVDRAMRRRRYAKTALRWVRRLARVRGWSERRVKSWTRRRFRLKQVMRPLRLATHQSAKRFRKGTRQVLRHVGAR
jgi:hypothetical protein